MGSIPQCRVMAILEYCKVLMLVPTMVVAMPLAGQHKVLDTDKVVDLEGETVNMLDAMVQLMQGGGEFDRSYLSKLSTCMHTISPELWSVSDGAWRGVVEYHDMDGAGNDTWGSCLGSGHCHRYHEQNLTVQDYHNIGIYEPCNYASNLAYYHVVTMICDNKEWSLPREYTTAMAQAFTSLTVGSAFWHGSHTLLGNIADNRCIDVVSYLAHQASLANLPVSSQVMELSLEPRARSSVATAQQLADMLRSQPVDTWADGIAALDTPDYMLTFSGLVCTLLTLQLSTEQVDTIVPPLMDAFNLPDDARAFIFDHYLPEIRLATANTSFGILELGHFQLNTVGTLTKIIYAFLWQEYALTDNDIFLDPEVNILGASAMVSINKLADWLNDFPMLDPALQTGYGTYPGDTWCNPQEPHSKWHVESANGLMDLMMLSDNMFRLTM